MRSRLARFLFLVISVACKAGRHEPVQGPEPGTEGVLDGLERYWRSDQDVKAVLDGAITDFRATDACAPARGDGGYSACVLRMARVNAIYYWCSKATNGIESMDLGWPETASLLEDIESEMINCTTRFGLDPPDRRNDSRHTRIAVSERVLTPICSRTRAKAYASLWRAAECGIDSECEASKEATSLGCYFGVNKDADLDGARRDVEATGKAFEKEACDSYPQKCVTNPGPYVCLRGHCGPEMFRSLGDAFEHMWKRRLSATSSPEK